LLVNLGYTILYGLTLYYANAYLFIWIVFLKSNGLQKEG
jgi:hypothetical protein